MVHYAMGLDIEELDASELDSMEPDKEPEPWSPILGQRSCAVICLFGHFFLDLYSLSFEKGSLGWDMPLSPQWWHMGDLLMVGNFWVAETSPLILSFPLSSTVGGGSGTVGLTKTVLKVEGISEGGATYPRPVLSVRLF
jgi:hypothetical protein